MFGINRELDAFWSGMIFGAILIVYFYLSNVSEDGGPSRLARWTQAFNARYVMSRGAAADRAADVVHYQRETAAEPNRTEPPNLPNAAAERAEPFGTSAFALNPQEVAAVGRMIEHKATAEKANKASTIWAGFGIKKGESARYKRASEIYDTLFVLQPDFPALEATRRVQWEGEQAALN
jgi:hypothetical protein